MASPATAVRLWRAFPKPIGRSGVALIAGASASHGQAKKDKGKREGYRQGSRRQCPGNQASPGSNPPRPRWGNGALDHLSD